MQIVIYVLCAIGSYLLGSISFASLFSKLIKHDDVREHGSGNAGTTNMIRTYGWGLGIATFVCDGLKGAIAVFVSHLLGGDIGLLLGSIFVVAGHNWPIFFKFRGGKGVATTAGALAVMMPLETAIIFAFCLVIIAIWRLVSRASIIGAVLIIAAALIFHWGQVYMQAAIIVMGVFMLIAHRSNMKRIIENRENKLPLGKQK